MRIGEVARRAGVNIETLRYYERRGLLAEPGPSAERPPLLRRRDRALRRGDQGGAGARLHARRDRRVRCASPAAGGAHEAIRVRLAAEDRRGRREAREPAPRPRRAWRSVRRLRLRLARPLHLRRGLPRAARARPALGPLAARHERRERGQHAAPDRPRRVRARRGRTCCTRGRCRRCRAHELRGVRARFLRRRAAGAPSARCSVAELARPRRSCSRRGRRAVVLWFEHDLYDQLQLLQVARADCERRELIRRRHVPRPAERRRARGALAARARRVSDAAARARTRGLGRVPRAGARPRWRPARRATPPRCRSSARRCTGCSRSCPTPSDGLSRSERQLLEPLLEGPAPAARALRSRARRARRRRSTATPGSGSGWPRSQPLVDDAGARHAPPLGDRDESSLRRPSS